MGKFDKEIGRSLFRDIKGICRARTYEPLVRLYALAKEHNIEKNAIRFVLSKRLLPSRF